MLVGLDGLEPSTSRLSGARSSHLSYRPVFLRLFSSSISQGFTLDGGDEGIRTLDPLLAGQVLSQLSYTPKGIFQQSLEIEQQLMLSNFVLRRLFCFFVSYEKSYFNSSCSP